MTNVSQSSTRRATVAVGQRCRHSYVSSMHWAGWTRENVRMPPGYATKARQIPAVVGSSVGAETAAWQQITQMAIVDFFASGTAMQIEAESSWIIAGAGSSSRERESWRHTSTGYGREVKSGLDWTNHVPLHSFFVSVLYGRRATCSLKEPCLLQTTPMASPAPIDSV